MQSKIKGAKLLQCGQKTVLCVLYNHLYLMKDCQFTVVSPMVKKVVCLGLGKERYTGLD
jgi:hypothetical protein